MQMLQFVIKTCYNAIVTNYIKNTGVAYEKNNFYFINFINYWN